MNIKYLGYLLLSAFVSIQAQTYGQQFNIKIDTASLTQKKFSDTSTVRHFIDSIYKHKQVDLPGALKLITFAVNRSLELKNPGLQAKALNVKGAIYEDMGMFEDALENHYEALKIFEKIPIPFSIAITSNNIGRVYLESGKLKDAVSYLSRAETIAKKNRFDKALVYVYTNFANVYIRLNELPKALKYGLMSDSLNNFIKLKNVQSVNANNIGALYYYLNDMKKASEYYNKAKRLSLESKDMVTYHRAEINLGELYEVTKEQDPLPYYEKALFYFGEISDNEAGGYAANNISNYYKSKGDYRKALEYFQLSVDKNLKHTGLQAAKNMALLQTQYETEKKEQEIIVLGQENTIQKMSIAGRNKTIAIISGLFILSGIFAGIIHNRNKYKQRAVLQAQMLDQRNMLTQAVIDAEEKERKRIARDLHDGVGQLFSAVKMNLNGLFDRVKLDRDEDKFLAEKTLALVDESCKEVRVISHQMIPNMLLRSGIASDVKSFIEKLDSEKLKVSFEATGFKNKLESNVEIVLYRVIQETVNNVIKHSQATSLGIKLARNSDNITAEINDNGIGFDTSNLANFEGIGLKNIAARLDYLKGNVIYLSNENGTKVLISVPL